MDGPGQCKRKERKILWTYSFIQQLFVEQWPGPRALTATIIITMVSPGKVPSETFWLEISIILLKS